MCENDIDARQRVTRDLVYIVFLPQVSDKKNKIGKFLVKNYLNGHYDNFLSVINYKRNSNSYKKAKLMERNRILKG